MKLETTLRIDADPLERPSLDLFVGWLAWLGALAYALGARHAGRPFGVVDLAAWGVVAALMVEGLRSLASLRTRPPRAPRRSD